MASTTRRRRTNRSDGKRSPNPFRGAGSRHSASREPASRKARGDGDARARGSASRRASASNGREGRGGSRKVRYAVIGLGHIAQVAVLPAFKNAAKNSELTALISDDEQKLKTLGNRYKVPYAVSYEQAEDLFRTGEIDAVYIALPNDMHAEWTVKAANAKLHVLCEKPMATSSEECERMIRACEENGVKLMIAYRLHFERANLEVAEIVRSKKIGEARYFNSQFSMQVKEGNIRVQAERGGGPEWDIGIYCLNAARYVFGEEPVQVWATQASSNDERFREVPEAVTAVMRFPNERLATFTCSFGANDRSRYEVVGTKGSVVMDPAFEYAEGLRYELTLGEKKQKPKQFDKSDQFAPELLYFSDCILRNRDPEPSGEEGLIDVRIIEALHRSIRSGTWQDVETPEKTARPSLRQEIRQPGIDKPDTVNVQQPH